MKRILQLRLQKADRFPVEEFMSIGFTHHCQIITSVKDRDECLYYIRRAATEHYRAEDLRRSIRNDDYRHRSLGLASDHDPPCDPAGTARAERPFRPAI